MNQNDSSKSLLWVVLSLLSGYFVFWCILVFYKNYPMVPGAAFICFKEISMPFPAWFKYSIAFSIVFSFFAIMLNPFRSKDAFGGAHWANEKEIKNLGLRNDEGMVLGLTKPHGSIKKDKNGVRHTPKVFGAWGAEYLRTDQPLSALVYAPPGSGKTTGVVIPSVLASNNSLVILDPKGEVFKMTAGAKSQIGTIIKYDPGKDNSASWNPLSKQELPQAQNDIQVHVSRIAESIIANDQKDGSASMWVSEGRTMFRFWAMFLIYKNGETSFSKIFESSVEGQYAIQAAIESNPDLPQRIKNEGISFVDMADKQFDGIFGTFKNSMNLFNDERVAKNTTKSDFTFKDLRNETITVYLVVSMPDIERLKPIISLFFELGTLSLLEKEPTGKDQKITFILDEFVRLQKMTQVITLPDVGRGYKFNAIFICQSISQLKNVYGEHLTNALRNTCSFHLIFSQNEFQEAKLISDSVGDFTFKKVTKNERRSLLQGGSESEQGMALIRSQDIMSMDFGQMFILVQGAFETPIACFAPFYFLDKSMSSFIGLPINIEVEEEAEAEEDNIPSVDALPENACCLLADHNKL